MTKELEIVRKLQHCGVEEYRIALEKVEKILLEYEQIKNTNPSEALESLEDIGFAALNECYGPPYTRISDEYDEDFKTIKNYILKSQKQEKENELLKEIIKSFFDRGCPLHQYTDKEGILTIEVDNECSIMHLGEFKGVDLDKKLKEVLE